MVRFVYSPEPAVLASKRYDTIALRFTISLKRGVRTLTSAEWCAAAKERSRIHIGSFACRSLLPRRGRSDCAMVSAIPDADRDQSVMDNEVASPHGYCGGPAFAVGLVWYGPARPAGPFFDRRQLPCTVTLSMKRTG